MKKILPLNQRYTIIKNLTRKSVSCSKIILLFQSRKIDMYKVLHFVVSMKIIEKN